MSDRSNAPRPDRALTHRSTRTCLDRRAGERWGELGRSGASGVLNNIRYTAAHEQGRGLTAEWLPMLGCITAASRGSTLQLKVQFLAGLLLAETLHL
jgi:hypothetical protein